MNVEIKLPSGRVITVANIFPTVEDDSGHKSGFNVWLESQADPIGNVLGFGVWLPYGSYTKHTFIKEVTRLAHVEEREMLHRYYLDQHRIDVYEQKKIEMEAAAKHLKETLDLESTDR